MNLKPFHYLIAAVICGVIAVMIINEAYLAKQVAAAGAAGGFAASVGLLGIAAALAGRNE